MQEEKPNEIKEEYVELNIPEPQLTGHMWRQMGAELVCQSCTFRHAQFIDPSLQLYGIDEKGNPMIRKIAA